MTWFGLVFAIAIAAPLVALVTYKHFREKTRRRKISTEYESHRDWIILYDNGEWEDFTGTISDAIAVGERPWLGGRFWILPKVVCHDSDGDCLPF
jgi:hypothetical protein